MDLHLHDYPGKQFRFDRVLLLDGIGKGMNRAKTESESNGLSMKGGTVPL